MHTATNEVQSILYMARQWQQPPNAIARTFAKLGIAPAQVVDGIARYAAEDADRVYAEMVAAANKGPANFRDSIQTKEAVSSPPRTRRGSSPRGGAGEAGN